MKPKFLEDKSDVKSLIHEIECRRVLWDKKHKLYGDRVGVEKAFDQIAQELNKNKKLLKIKWRNLRHQFYKEIRRNPVDKDGNPILDQYPGKWEYYELLLFLKDNVIGVQRASKPAELAEEKDNEFYEEEHLELQYDEQIDESQTEDLAQEENDFSAIKMDLGLEGDIEGDYTIDPLDIEDGEEIQEDTSESDMETQAESNEPRRLSQQTEFIERPKKRKLTELDRFKMRQKRREIKARTQRQNGIQKSYQNCSQNGIQKSYQNSSQNGIHKSYQNGSENRIQNDSLEIPTVSSRHVDEDFYFALSLVPYLRRLDPLRKLLVRHEMQKLLIGELIGESSSKKTTTKKPA